jgi:quercetin dioxygenase-like cupin family protein
LLHLDATNSCPADRSKGHAMTCTINTLEASDKLYVLGETLRPLLTNAMGSAVEIFDTSGPANAGPPPHHHPWEEVYVVISGEIEVTVDGDARVVSAGGVAHVPANVKHAYRNLTDAHFLTIVTKGNATKFFTEVAADIEMSPPDIPGVVRVAASHGIEFVM